MGAKAEMCDRGDAGRCCFWQVLALEMETGSGKNTGKQDENSGSEQQGVLRAVCHSDVRPDPALPELSALGYLHQCFS